MVNPVEQRDARIDDVPHWNPRRVSHHAANAEPEGRVAEHQREHRRQPQEQSGGWPPANELERGGLDAMAERAEHRVGQRAFIPGARNSGGR